MKLIFQNQGQNVGYVPIYPSLPTQAQAAVVIPPTMPAATQQEAGPAQPAESPKSRERSPSLPSVPSQTSLKAEVSVSSRSGSGSGTGSGGVLRAVSLKEENGVLKPEYDPEELRRWQEENGYNVPQAESSTTHEETIQNVDNGNIARPQSSPGFERRESPETRPEEYIGYARRGSLATPQIINPRTQEVLTPIPIPFFDHRPQDHYGPSHTQGPAPFEHRGPPQYDYGPVGQRPHPRHRIRVDNEGYPRQQHPLSEGTRPWRMGQGW
jgi:hypothetical protein